MQGLETGCRDFCTHVVRQGDIVFAFQSPLNPENAEFSKHHATHGDGVRDVAFCVDDAAGIFQKAVSRGAEAVREPETLKDENGSVVVASVKTYGDTIHTFIQRVDYKGPFIPGYRAHHLTEKINELMPAPGLKAMDHCVGN
jgi:4-hydroxyphenylpyruvate dioxygenase